MRPRYAPIRAVRPLRKLALSLLLITAFLTTGASPTRAQLSKQPGNIEAVRLLQDHYFFGPTVLTVCPKGVHIDFSKHMGFDLVSQAPDWTVTVFRPDEKTIKSLSLKEFENSGMIPQLLQTSRPRYVPSNAPPHAFKYLGYEAKRVTNIYQTQEYLNLKNVAPQEVERIVYAAYRLPTGGGIPLRYISVSDSRDFFSGRDKRGQKETNLSTSSLKKILVPASFFMAPKNYRTVSQMQDVAVSSKTRAQSVDFQNVFEIANPERLKARVPAK